MRTFRLQTLKKISKIIGNLHHGDSINQKFVQQKYNDKSIDGTRWIRVFKFFMSKKNDSDIILFIEQCFSHTEFTNRKYEYKQAINEINILLNEYGMLMSEMGDIIKI